MFTPVNDSSLFMSRNRVLTIFFARLMQPIHHVSFSVMCDIQLKLIGGYVEDSGKGLILSQRILTFFAQHHLPFSLKLCCLGPANTKTGGRRKPLVGGCVCNISNGMVFPADFNRTFVDKLPDEAIKTLMLGPSLIKKPNKLKQMILAQEDQGFSYSNRSMGPIRDI
jgi:hypothetical protein